MTYQPSIVGPIVDPNDPWQVATNAYDPHKYYIRSTDGKGHSDSVMCSMSPAIKVALTQAIANRDVPVYRSVADFIRDAAVHRLHFVAEATRNQTLLRVETGERVAAVIEMQRLIDKQRKDTIESAKQILFDLANRGRWSAAAVILDELAEMMVEIGEGDDESVIAIQEIVDKYEYTHRRDMIVKSNTTPIQLRPRS